MLPLYLLYVPAGAFCVIMTGVRKWYWINKSKQEPVPEPGLNKNGGKIKNQNEGGLRKRTNRPQPLNQISDNSGKTEKQNQRKLMFESIEKSENLNFIIHLDSNPVQAYHIGKKKGLY